MKRILTYLLLFVSVATVFSQNAAKNEFRAAGQTTIIRIDRAPNNWARDENDGGPSSNVPISGNEDVSFYSTPEGIFITVLNGTNKINLYALTGQLLFSKDLPQGRFLIQTRKGIYFLKINNKSYKAICK